MNEGFKQSVMDELLADVETGVGQLVSATREDLKASISVPVGVRTGPRGGTILIRSKPGEPPRKETGRYLQSWNQAVLRNGSIVEGVVFSDVIYGSYLTTGTKHMAKRPHIEVAFEKMRAKATDQF